MLLTLLLLLMMAHARWGLNRGLFVEKEKKMAGIEREEKRRKKKP